MAGIIFILLRIASKKAQNVFSFCEELTLFFQQILSKFEGKNISRFKGLSFCDLCLVVVVFQYG